MSSNEATNSIAGRIDSSGHTLHTNHSGPRPRQDLPRPSVLENPLSYTWDDGADADKNYRELGRLLHQSGDLFRHADHAGGLLLASPDPLVPPTPITTGKRLAAIIIDRVQIQVVSDGKPRGPKLPAYHRDAMLQSEVFLQEFRVIEQIVARPMVLGDFSLTQPGYNDGGQGFRTFYAGEAADVSDSIETIEQFLDVMEFADEADRTNAVGAALTRLLRNHWHGGKPIAILTSTKSHGGKGTLVDFLSGPDHVATIDYQPTNWAMERSFVGTLGVNPDAGVINVDNARLYRGERSIASAFLERWLTDPRPTLFSTGTGGPTVRNNDLMLAVTTNEGTVSTDLANRGLPIHLTPSGNVHDRDPALFTPFSGSVPTVRRLAA